MEKRVRRSAAGSPIAKSNVYETLEMSWQGRLTVPESRRVVEMIACAAPVMHAGRTCAPGKRGLKHAESRKIYSRKTDEQVH